MQLRCKKGSPQGALFVCCSFLRHPRLGRGSPILFEHISLNGKGDARSVAGMTGKHAGMTGRETGVLSSLYFRNAQVPTVRLGHAKLRLSRHSPYTVVVSRLSSVGPQVRSFVYLNTHFLYSVKLATTYTPLATMFAKKLDFMNPEMKSVKGLHQAMLSA